MAEKTSADISAIAQLEDALTDPEPMCLAVLELELPPNSDGSDYDVEIVEEAQRRLRDTLRDYDELNVVDDRRFALVLRTLADASIMDSRMRKLHDIMTRPYPVDGQELEVIVYLGSAIRIPQESPSELLTRVEQALQQARTADSPDQVMQ